MKLKSFKDFIAEGMQTSMGNNPSGERYMMTPSTNTPDQLSTLKQMNPDDEDEEQDPWNPSIINKDAAKTAGGNVAYHKMSEGGLGDNQIAGQPVFTQHVDKSKQGYQDAMYYEEDPEDEEE
jgi:hypothetical protein